MIRFLFFILISVVSSLGFVYVYLKFNDISLKFSVKIIAWFIIGMIFQTLVKFYNLSALTYVSYFIFYPVLFYLLAPLSFRKLFYYTFVVWILGIFLDLLSMLIVMFMQLVWTFDIYSLVSRIVLTFIVFAFLIMMGHSKKLKKLVRKIYEKVQKIDYFNFAILFFAIVVLLIGIGIFMNLSHIDISVLLTFVIVLLSVVFYLLVKLKVNLNESLIFMNLLKSNNEFYLKIEDENRIFKHNLIAKLLAIKSVSGKKARMLIDDFIKSFNNDIDFSVHIKDMPYGLNGIIYEKIYPYLSKLNIKIYNKINFDIFQKLKSRRYNVFVEKMIISLDNAIEACMNSIDKILIVNLFSEENCIYIEIKNTFSENLNVDNLGLINYSTKGKRRGLGLFSLLRDDEVSMKIKIINEWFITTIMAKENANDD